MSKKKNIKKADNKQAYAEELCRYNKLYNKYLFKYLQMNNYQLKRERFLCEKEIRSQSIVSDNSRIAIVISFFTAFSTILLTVLKFFDFLSNGVFSLIVAFLLIGGFVYLLNQGSKSQNETRGEIERYYLKIEIIDKILNERNKKQ